MVDNWQGMGASLGPHIPFFCISMFSLFNRVSWAFYRLHCNHLFQLYKFFYFFILFKSKALVVLDNSHSWGRRLSGFCAPNPHMQPPNGSAPHARVCLNLAPMPTINIKSNKTILSFLFTQNKTKIKSSYSLLNDPMPKPPIGGHVAIDVISVPCILYYFAMSSWPTTGPT